MIRQQRSLRVNRARGNPPSPVIATANVTGIGGLWRMLSETSALIVLCQEHKALAEDIPEASRKAARLGWRSFWTPAARTEKQGKTSGVAILGRMHLDMWAPTSQPHAPNRAVGAVWRSRGLGTLMLYSIYCQASTGPGGFNSNLVHTVTKHASSQGVPYIVGGDWNMQPETLAQQSLIGEAGAKILTGGSTPTFVSGRAQSVLNLFLVAGAASHVIREVVVEDTSSISNHKPVLMHFSRELLQSKCWVPRRFWAPPVRRQMGPNPPPGRFDNLSPHEFFSKDGWRRSSYRELRERPRI